MAMDNSDPPSSSCPQDSGTDNDTDLKRRKLSHNSTITNDAKINDNTTSSTKDDTAVNSQLLFVEHVLGTQGTATEPPLALQSLLPQGQRIRQDLYKLQSIFDAAQFRTSIVQSPRLAVSVYKDSCTTTNTTTCSSLVQQQDYLLTMLGLHPEQEAREADYKNHMREQYCVSQFLAHLRVACRRHAMKDARVQEWMQRHDRNHDDNDGSEAAPSRVSALELQTLMSLLLQADPKLRQEQLDHELERIRWHNCTLANALLQQFIYKYHSCIIKDVFFKTSHVAKYERITFYLYDSDIDMVKPSSNFIFLPDLPRVLKPKQQQGQQQQQQSMDGGMRTIVQDMMATFWNHLLRHGGYYASATMKEQLSPALERYFLSGLRQDPNIPLKLNAHFDPCEPISLYLWGKAGAGKSSFVRHVPMAIQAAVEIHADPEMLVRFVKQTLNKPNKDLRLEMELRANNNDLSVMSIIQSRKCTMTQSKPGLVVIGLEEMPQYFAAEHEEHDPNQVKACQLISQRFGGRKGEYDSLKAAPRNSEKRGIGNDASLITLFTSNYTLEGPSREALQRLPMFQHLTVVEMTAISGNDRKEFAHAYFRQSIMDRIQSLLPSAAVELESIDIPLGEGDTRPLVRHLRMLAYYASATILTGVNGELELVKARKNSRPVTVSVVQKDKSCQVIVGNKPPLALHVGTLDNLFPVIHQIFDPRTQKVMDNLRSKTDLSEGITSESSTIIDFWLGGALTPAVILTHNKLFVQTLIEVIQEALKSSGVQCISDIEAGSYKMMKSLYDARDTPNLRDDIFQSGGGRKTVGGVGNSALVAIELKCPTTDAQLCLREMLEDTPSMTAFSSDKSALYKSGLLFAVHLQGNEITPELESRASLIL